MTAENRTTAYVLGCDLSLETGEGFLAHSLIDLIQARFDIIIYNDLIVRQLCVVPVFRDRVLPIYLFIVCLMLRLYRRRVILLNYVPIWNFLNAILARCGVHLAPITGSVFIVPARASRRELIKRRYVQRILVALSGWLLPRDKFIWCATHSVYQQLNQAGFSKIGLGIPYLSRIKPFPYGEKNFDIFIYSGNHPIKNHDAVLQFLENPLSRNFTICYVGPPFNFKPNVSCFNSISEQQFDILLSSARIYLTFSFEDSGITGFKALANSMPVMCPRRSGLAHATSYDEDYCFEDPYDSEILYHMASKLLCERSTKFHSQSHNIFAYLKAQHEKASGEWISSL